MSLFLSFYLHAANTYLRMEEKEVAEILREAAENKINAKNTWQSTLIDNFSNIEQFKDKPTNSMNFQHVSIVLDGCVRIYSTRVDNVVGEAEQLMESIGRAKETEKPRVREKKRLVLDALPENISLQKKIISPDSDILEYLSRESKEGDTRGLLMNLLKWSDYSGLQILPLNTHKKLPPVSEEIPDISAYKHVFANEKNNICISRMFSEFTPEKSLNDIEIPTYAYQISYDNEPMPQIIPADLDFANECEQIQRYDQEEEKIIFDAAEENINEIADGSSEQLLERIEKKELRLSITPFGYFKGWAGPAHWKIQSKRKYKQKEKEREKKKVVIDFLTAAHLPISTLFEKDDKTVLTPQQITGRRTDNNTFPPDYNMQPEDLYHMLLIPDMLYVQKKLVSVHKNQNLSDSYQNEDPAINNNKEMQVEEPMDVCIGADTFAEAPEDTYMDVQQVPTYRAAEEGREGGSAVKEMNSGTYLQSSLLSTERSMLSRRLLQSTLRRARRNDISQIKECLWNEIEKGETEVEQIYSCVKNKEVSVQFCLVSLLHLANEKNLRITTTDPGTLSPIENLLLLAPNDSIKIE